MNDFFKRHIILENNHVKLVPFSSYYEEGLRKIIFDNEITKYTGNHFISDNDLKNYINRTLTSRNENVSYPFIVIDQSSGQIAGSTRFGNLVFHNKRLEIGWTWYGQAFRGTIVNKAAKFELLRYAFEEMDFNRVQFSVDVENIRSQKAVLKLGAKLEGVFRSNYVNADGECRDDVYFSIIKSDWQELKRTVFNEL
ncbi:N-acetyltransferase [Paenibacillus baekrokdamisoli]|uniref:N-acetyltransferase n=1 Tax=Paenibacillus baekrokdamisoli TaxID=1712516 RepID=A0A3G9J621_9BACL|nr:GNAT family protein [Paenibacillus baekrokdamisoli]MBB3068910.1 RimJ/RimL family protein N-acetyltransferase [Paenibacillus baekrokdamisoli]BBH23735.1 N-acetyltransferase [Paenibacillus baekrokdamisoli]